MQNLNDNRERLFVKDTHLNLNSDRVNLVARLVLFTQCPGDTVQTATGKVDSARKFKCTPAAREEMDYKFYINFTDKVNRTASIVSTGQCSFQDNCLIVYEEKIPRKEQQSKVKMDSKRPESLVYYKRNVFFIFQLKIKIEWSLTKCKLIESGPEREMILYII